MIPWSGKTFNPLYANKISQVQGTVFSMSERGDMITTKDPVNLGSVNTKPRQKYGVKQAALQAAD